MRLYLQFLTTLIVVFILGCTSRSPDSDSKNANPNSERAAISIEKDTLPKKAATPFPKPNPGEVHSFFKRYGEKNPETKVTLKTRLGDIQLRLYKETPIHRANFIYNIKEELYHKTIFYRVVPDFMIQGGNSDYPQTLEKREEAGSYYIPNESRPTLLHKRGSVAMAMTYDDNPTFKSAQYSYYIVIGTRFSDAGLDAIEEEYDISISESARKVYRTVGGTPHLDQKHTVFAEVIDGMEIVEAIADEKRDSGNWPINDVIIDYKIVE